MKTLYESAAGAVMPWNSIDAKTKIFGEIPQQDIEICLMCRHHDGACDSCDGKGNVTKKGRPKKEIDTDLLRELLRLKRCNADCCAALKISGGTLQKAKKKLNQEGIE